MKHIIGTCSLCDGPVMSEAVVWHGTTPDINRGACGKCGAVQKQPYGPVIEMEKPISKYTTVSEERVKEVQVAIEEAAAEKVCVWTIDEGNHESGCGGGTYRMADAVMTEVDVEYCPFCGGRLKEKTDEQS